MIWFVLALAAQPQAGPWTKYGGPAILYVQRSNGRDFVPFSSFARCEAFRKILEQESAEADRRNTESGFTTVPGTAPRYRCFPG